MKKKNRLRIKRTLYALIFATIAISFKKNANISRGLVAIPETKCKNIDITNNSRVLDDIPNTAPNILPHIDTTIFDNLLQNVIIPTPIPPTPLPSPTSAPIPEREQEKKLVALTFDDGPCGEYTEELAGLLWEYEIKSTFFVLKERVTQTPDALTQLYADGHEIAIHGATHTNLTKLSIDGVNDEIESTIDSIEDLGIIATYLVRPPYGAINNQMKENIEYPFIMWNIDTRDWETHDKDKIKEEIIENIDAGAIILMHDRKDVHECNMQALEELLPILTEEYKFVTVSELAEYYGTTLENGKVYRKIKIEE